MDFPKKVTINEVSPRDGLQNEKIIIPTNIKLEFIKQLAEAGLSRIEATSFVSPKRIPALADHTELMHQLKPELKTHYSALVPNIQGLQNAIDSGCQNIAVITAVSTTFAEKNMRCSIPESIERIQEITTIAKKNNISVRAYISCTLGCPYEGFIAPETSAEVAKILLSLGCDEIALADTIGTGTPKKAQALITAVNKYIPIEKIAIHFHDTYGQALANIYACLQLGISIIDSAAGGLGGCPYAQGATGNVATEEVLYLLHGLGIKTGIDLDKIIKASEFIHTQLKHESHSKVALALTAANRKETQ